MGYFGDVHASILDACCGMILIEGNDVINDVFPIKAGLWQVWVIGREGLKKTTCHETGPNRKHHKTSLYRWWWLSIRKDRNASKSAKKIWFWSALGRRRCLDVLFLLLKMLFFTKTCGTNVRCFWYFCTPVKYHSNGKWTLWRCISYKQMGSLHCNLSFPEGRCYKSIPPTSIPNIIFLFLLY